MTTRTLKTVEKDRTTGYSSAMTKDRALDFICDFVAIGIRVTHERLIMSYPSHETDAPATRFAQHPLECVVP